MYDQMTNMDDQVCNVFFTEEAFESFSMQPKFDINLFKTYIPAIETSTISPVKKSEKAPEIKSPTQSANIAASNTNQNQPKAVWTLRSPKPQFPYPRYSCLTHGQQQRYIDLWHKHGFCHSNQRRYSVSADDVTEKQELRKLQISVHKEQQDFMKYAEHVAKHSREDYEKLAPQALQYAKELWECQAQRVKKLPQYFSVCQTVGIAPAAVFPSDPILTSVAHNLLMLGKPCVVDESVLNKKANHNLVGASIKKEQLKGRQLRNKTEEHEELSRDVNAVKLAAKYHANIVISTEAFSTLADNHAPGYDKSWQIPVQIKSANSNDTSLKTVYISRPLQDRYYPHDASKAFHLNALQDLLTQDDVQTSTHGFRDSPTEMAFRYDDNSQDDLSKLETFGSYLGKTAKKISRENPPGFEAQAKSKLASKEDRNNENLFQDTAVPPSDDLHAVNNESLRGTSSDGNHAGNQQMSLIDHNSQANIESGVATSYQDESDVIWNHATQTVPLSEERQTSEEISITDCNPISQLHTSNSNFATNESCLTSLLHEKTVQRSQTYQNPRLASDGSETEGKLVIAVSSSDADSPNRANLKTASHEGQRNINEQHKDINLMKIKGNIEGSTLDDAPTPRRSRRLQKTQDDGPQSSTRRTIKTSSSGIDEKTETVIPDSPLSPPPHERGFFAGAPVISRVGLETSTPPPVLIPENGIENKTSVTPSCQRDGPESSSVSPQIKKQKFDYCGTTDILSHDGQRYNLRSKSGGNEFPDRNLTSEIHKTGLDTSSVLKDTLDKNVMLPESAIPASCPKANLESINANSCVDSKPNPTNKKHAMKRSRRPSQPGLESTIDSILKLQERLHSGKMASHQTPVQPLNSAASGHVATSSDGNACVENASDYKMSLGGCVGYSLWKFGKHSIIVKGSIDATSKGANDGNHDKIQVVNVIPKLEFQPHFGHEQISLSELTHLWMRLLLHPGSKVIQGRVNAVTSNLMLLEHFDMNSTIWEQPPFQPSRCMKMMFQILDKLTSLSEGTYLLRHSAGDMHACILQNVMPKGKTRSLYDLHQSYTQVHMLQSCPPQLLPWLPLDTNLMLPSHVAMGRIPATLPPKSTVKNTKKGPKGQGNATQGTSKKKKKKKKAKK